MQTSNKGTNYLVIHQIARIVFLAPFVSQQQDVRSAEKRVRFQKTSKKLIKNGQGGFLVRNNLTV